MTDYDDLEVEYSDEQFQTQPEPDADGTAVAAAGRHDGEQTVEGVEQAVQALGDTQRPPARADGGQTSLDEWGCGR